MWVNLFVLVILRSCHYHKQSWLISCDPLLVIVLALLEWQWGHALENKAIQQNAPVCPLFVPALRTSAESHSAPQRALCSWSPPHRFSLRVCRGNQSPPSAEAFARRCVQAHICTHLHTAYCFPRYSRLTDDYCCTR